MTVNARSRTTTPDRFGGRVASGIVKNPSTLLTSDRQSLTVLDMSHHTTPTVTTLETGTCSYCDEPNTEIKRGSDGRPACSYCWEPEFAGPTRFVVSLVSPLLDGPFEVDLIASSESAAIARTRMVAFNSYREASMLTADCTVEVVS